MDRENRNPLDTWTLGHLDSQAPQSSCLMIKGQFSLEDTETETGTETQGNLDEIKFHPFVSTLIRARVKSHIKINKIWHDADSVADKALA